MLFRGNSSKEVVCARCNDECYGDVVSACERHYHQTCFSCKVAGCKNNLIQDGYFSIDNELYCREDYHRLKGLMCARCNRYVEGLAISAINSFYHPTCFSCYHCNAVFIPHTAISYDGERMSCENCNAMENVNAFDSGSELINLTHNNRRDSNNANASVVTLPACHNSTNYDVSTSKCASCGGNIGEYQSLMALEKAWHLHCFTCNKCGMLLAEEYIGRDGIPYCEEDYQTEFGVSCAGCDGYITGKVLQAGGKHYHPACSRCGKCNELFGEGEEMYLRGSEIWHPSCSEETDITGARLSDTNMSDVELEENVSMNHGASSALHSIDTRKPEQYQEHNGPTRINSISDGDYADHQVNIWKPPPYRKSLSTSIGQPDGFHSIKPTDESFITTTSKEEEEEEENIPPPPKRSSSNSWRLKYSAGVYTPTPFQKTSYIKPVAHVKSLYSSSDVDREEECHEPLSVDTQHHSMDEGEINMEGSSPNTEASIQKGIGFNKLMYRRSLRENRK